MAVSDCFLKLDGIEGESKDHKHKNEIQVESWSWSHEQVGTGARATGAGGGSAGNAGGKSKVVMKDLSFTARSSKASPKIMMAAASGKPIASAVLVCRKAGHEQQEFLKITLSEVYVSSYHLGHGKDEVPFDQVTLNFCRVEVEYKEQKEDGSLGAAHKFGWDLKTNKAL